MGQVGSCEQEVMEGPPLKRRKTEADLALAVPRMTLKTSQSARRPPKRPKEDNARSVRPRPLHINDKMRVLWQGRDPEWDDLDGGAFARWLQSCDNAAQAKKEAEPSVKPQVLVVGHSFKALPEDDGAQEAGPAALLPADAGGDPIDVPRCRQLSKSRRSIDGGPSKSEWSVEGPYVRYVSPDGDGVESRVEYDMDDEDEEWLARFNGQAGSRGPRALSEDAFEMLVDHFEKALHSLLQRQVELWPAVIDPALEPPDISGMYSLERACESEDLAHISKASIEAVYKHWCKKREKAKQPLLQRLWFEQPWVRARDAGKEALPGVHKSSDSDLPFMGQDAPRPPTTRPRRMNAEEALYKLESIRTELETIRTMADQVRRRERGKKRELLQVREEWHRRAPLAPDGANDEAGPLEPGAPGGLPAGLPPDREARLATKAAAKVAREAATLITAQVMLDPSGTSDRGPSTEPGTSSATASRQAEKKESLHKPGAEHTGECFWCKQGGNLAGCSTCPRCFCFNCYKIRPGYGIVNWGRMLRAPEFNCAICSGREPASCEGDSVNGFVRKGFSMLPLPHGAAVVRGRGRVRGRGGGRSLQRLTVEAPSPVDIKPVEEPEAGSSDAASQPAAQPAVKPPTAAATRPAKPLAKAGRKQQALPARDGLRHTKQNYEKLAGVKRSRTKTAAARRLVVSVRRAPAVRRALPRHSDLPATKGRKPPLQRKASPIPPRNAHPEAKKPQADAKTVQPEAKKAKLDAKKAWLEVPAPLEEPVTMKAPAQLAEAAKAWKRPESVALATVRGRGSSRGGHLRQGSTRQTLAGSGSRKSTNAAGGGSVRGNAVAEAAAQGTTKSTPPDALASETNRQDISPCPTGIPGIERALRETAQPRRKARVEYVMSCRRHGTFRHDRVPRMVDFFAQHSVAGCRPEWAPLAQQPGESRALCEERLRSVFPFSSAAPLPGPLPSAASAAVGHQPQAQSAPWLRAQPAKPSSVAGKGKSACKQPVGQRSGVGANNSLLSVLERRNMSQAKGQGTPACGSAAAGLQPALQQQRLLSTATKPTSKQASAPTRPGPKRNAAGAGATGCSRCRWKAGGCSNCNRTKEQPSRKRARA